MAVVSRALIMLATLVGLPAAWVYYGPLPDGAQRVVDRFVEVTRDALGWKRPATVSSLQFDKAPPRYDRPQEVSPVSHATFDGNPSPVQLAAGGVSLPTPPPPLSAANDEIQMHLGFLKNLGVAQYALEKWGTGYRFKCAVPLGDNPDFTRQFEAIDADPLATVRQVVGDVTSWQNARHQVVGAGTILR